MAPGPEEDFLFSSMSWTTDSMTNLHALIKRLTVGKPRGDPSAPHTFLYPLYLVGWSSMLSWPWLALWVLAHLDESKVSHPHSKKANTFAICLWGFESIWFSSEHPHSRPPQNFCTSSPPSKPAWKKSKAVLMADSLELIFTSGCYDDFWVKSNQRTFPFLECMSNCSWSYIHWFHFIIIQEKQDFLKRSQWCCLSGPFGT